MREGLTTTGLIFIIFLILAIVSLTYVFAVGLNCFRDNIHETDIPRSGDMIDENLILTVSDKWREPVPERGCHISLTMDCPAKDGYNYLVKFTNDNIYYTYPYTYEKLQVFQSGIGYGYQYSQKLLSEFYPVNFTRVSDIRGEVLVI